MSASSRTPYVALDFTQQSDVVKIPSVNVTGAATFAVWIKPLKSTPLGYIIFKKSTFAIALQDQEIVVAFGNIHPGWKWIHSDWRAPLDQWSHVMVTYDEANQSTGIFINGVLRKRAEVRGALSSCDNMLQVGVKSFKKTGTTKTRYMGCIADVRIWATVLAEQDIARRWAMPLAGDEPLLVGWWPFDEGAGTTVGDRTPSGLHGELSGPKWHMSVVVPESDLSAHMRIVLRDHIGSDVILRAACSDPDGTPDDDGEVGDEVGEGDSTSDETEKRKKKIPPAVDGKGDAAPVHAHKAILAARCEVFRAMFTSGMKEAKQETVVLSDIQPRTLQLLVEYLYTDQIEIEPDLAVDMFIVADRYRLERLQRMCECVILSNLSTENVCHILETADALNATQLRGIAFRWIIHNFGDVLRSPGFTELDKSLQYEVNLSASRMHFGKKLTVSNGGSSSRNTMDVDTS